MIANDYGIKKIYYIERYPGIAMNHVNAIGDEKDRAEFVPFSGAIAKRTLNCTSQLFHSRMN